MLRAVEIFTAIEGGYPPGTLFVHHAHGPRTGLIKASITHLASGEDVDVGVLKAVDIEAEGQTENGHAGVPDVVSSEEPELHEACAAQLYAVAVHGGSSRHLDKGAVATGVQERRCPCFETERRER